MSQSVGSRAATRAIATKLSYDTINAAGYGNQTLIELIELLHAAGAETLVDIRAKIGRKIKAAKQFKA